MQVDRTRISVEVFVLLYQLADKYCFERLRRYCLRCLDHTPFVVYFPLLHHVYPSLESMHHELKEIIASSIAQDYRLIRSDGHEAAVDFREWLTNDSDLCFMVMDKLADIADSKTAEVEEMRLNEDVNLEEDMDLKRQSPRATLRFEWDRTGFRMHF